ncbi:MAG: hypothetical protein ACMUEL_06520 [Flavobacteriales bacterium Tduv]
MIVNSTIIVSPLAQKGPTTYVVEAWKEESKKQISQRKERVKKENQSGV